MTAHHVVDANLISVAEAVAVGFALFRRQVRMAILIAVFDIGPAVIIEVLTGSFDAVLKPLTAKLIEFVWRSVPRPVRCAHAPIRCT